MTYLSPIVEGGEAERLAPLGAEPGRLWSLWDMMRFAAEACFRIGMEVKHVERLLRLVHIQTGSGGILGVSAHTEIATPTGVEIAEIQDALVQLHGLALQLTLPVTSRLIQRALAQFPKTDSEFGYIVDAFRSELEEKTFLFIPSDRAKYFDHVLPEVVARIFPEASQELGSACNAFSCGLYTASVFHAMRAAEIGVRSIGADLGVEFPFGIELADWHNILDQIDGKIRDMKSLPRGQEKTKALQFYSEAASQFRYFKDGWRTRVAHGRACFEERPAQDVLNHTMSFFLTLSSQKADLEL